jgi:hypothetical protein
MKTRTLFLLSACILLLQSCHEEATVQVTNKVHNVRLDNISFSKASVGSYLLTGETTEAVLSDNDKSISFPLSSQVEFYMVKGDKRVYLRTRDFLQYRQG